MYFLYIVRCKDGTLYTGITTDVKSRLASHESGLGAKYVRGRGPVKLVYKERHSDRSSASRRENQIKRWSRTKKLQLIMRA